MIKKLERLKKDNVNVHACYPIEYKDLKGKNRVLKRSRSSENLIFGGITTNE